MTSFCVLASMNAVSGQSPGTTDSGTHQMVRAAGMPLRDGALPPGTLTVRLVRGSFDGDLMGHTVEVEVAGQRTLRAQTGEQGRAQFAHLPIGATVRAAAVIGGERLQSDAFTIPAESGLRVLLVTGMGSSEATPLEAVPAATTTSSAEAATVPAAQPSGIFIDAATLVRIGVISLTVCTFAGVGLQQWWRRRH
jgi:hypothetical protein